MIGFEKYKNLLFVILGFPLFLGISNPFFRKIKIITKTMAKYNKALSQPTGPAALLF
jgi:hypothetical protein